jgi:uncharacterized membrane protein YciS (DUF1049 family)
MTITIIISAGGILLSVIINIVAIAFFIGKMSVKVDDLREDIKRLEHKQEESNKVKERTIISEENIKAIWKRIDELRGC